MLITGQLLFALLQKYNTNAIRQISIDMTTDLYHNIYTNEIFQKSQCIWHENTFMDIMRSLLINLGYESVNSSNKVWTRGDQRVVLCVVDDYTTCSENYDSPVSHLFDRNTTVITDNLVTCPTQYSVIQLPESFFGIYSYQPDPIEWQPSRRFNFAVNRLDYKRLLMMLEIAYRTPFDPENTLTDFVNDYINFNCWDWDGNNDSVEGLRENFAQQFERLEDVFKEVYQPVYQQLLTAMPVRNHSLSQEQVHISAWINLVMETYSSDTVIALSEKVFRALSTPAPWLVYAGKYTVSYLERLGFDVYSDLIDHRYDRIIENKTAAYGDKMVEYIFVGSEKACEFSEADFDQLKLRCQQAADHNRQLLKKMRQAWPGDFAAWLPAVLEKIQ